MLGVVTGRNRMNRFLKTFSTPRLGIAGVTAFMLGAALSSAGAQAPAAQTPIAQAPAPTPTVAVLPLENSSGEAAQDFFAGGMTDEIAAALTSVRTLAVVARSSSFRLPPSSHDLKAIGATLNARYLVQGSARLA